MMLSIFMLYALFFSSFFPLKAKAGDAKLLEVSWLRISFELVSLYLQRVAAKFIPSLFIVPKQIILTDDYNSAPDASSVMKADQNVRPAPNAIPRAITKLKPPLQVIRTVSPLCCKSPRILVMRSHRQLVIGTSATQNYVGLLNTTFPMCKTRRSALKSGSILNSSFI